ncbi:MAG: hypothetical protein HY747_07755 [Elusimicrobia bacterium]|nr:hypothetical protein [Elusimicrobiota bacterium]
MVFLFVIILGLNIRLAQSQENTDTAWLGYEENYFGIDENLLAIQEWAESFDTMGHRVRRRSNTGDFVSRFGTIAASACISGLGATQKSKATDTFEEDLGLTFSQIKTCYEQYPEFEGLLKDVTSILRRSVVTCQSKDSAHFAQNPGISAYACSIHGLNTPQSHGRSVGRHAGYEHFYYMVVPDSLPAFNAYSQIGRTKLYFHESLHNTGANNLPHHNIVEFIDFDPNRPCQQNMFGDRIIFLETICGFHAQIKDFTAISQRIAECGINPACVDILTDSPAESMRQGQLQYFYGHPFNENDAGLICQKIRDNLAAEIQNRSRLNMARHRIAVASGTISQEGRPMMRQDTRSDAQIFLDETMGNDDAFNLEAPAYYLAALPPEDRALLASVSSLNDDLENCRVRADGMVFANSQSEGCPLSNTHELFEVTEKLVDFNNQEVALRNGSMDILSAVLAGINSPSGAAWDQLETKTEELYDQYCPSAPNIGEFFPNLCFNGKTMILEAINAAHLAVSP